MFIDGAARRESLAAYALPLDELRAPQCDPSAMSPDDRVFFLEAIKPKRYAAFARCISDVLDYAVTSPMEPYPHSANQVVNWDDQFDELGSCAMVRLSESIDATCRNKSFRVAAEYVELVHSLDNERFYDLRFQLNAGANTATENIKSWLRGMPGLLEQKTGKAASLTELESVARNSLSLPWQLAMMSVNQMMALRSASMRDDQHGERLGRLEARHFKVAPSGLSIRYARLGGLVLPQGYAPYSDHSIVPPLETDTMLEDIATSQEVTIGCPITLLKHGMQRLWDWHIDAVVERGLWEGASASSGAAESLAG